jgi:putative DNA primase/helicase
LDFLTAYHRVNVSEAIKMFLNDIDPGAGDPKKNVSKPKKTPQQTKWEQVTHPEIEPTNFNHFELGAPDQYWTYHNTDGSIHGYACRFNLDKGKQVLPFTCQTDGNQTKWMYKGFSKPRLMYNAHLINDNPKAIIVIVEGEKTADAGQKHFPSDKYVFTTWMGGSNGIKTVDYSLIEGRKIILIPDHDTEQKYGEKHSKAGQVKPWNEQPGNAAMLEINEIIKSQSKTVKWVAVPNLYPHKWDIADKDWTENELSEFIKQNLIEVPTIAKTPESKPAPKKQKPAKKSIVYSNDYFRMLGYDKDENSRLVYFFFSYNAKTVIKLSPPSMNKSNLLMLAPINYWEDNFPGNKTKVDIDAVQNYLVGKSHKIGMFKDKFIRGRGAWIDNDNIIVHTGESIVDYKKTLPLKEYQSNFVYEVGENLGYGTENPLNTNEAHELLNHFDFLNWEREINGYLIAGWCVLAPFCGVLSWRPHIWVTGPAGSGKSWVMENMIKHLMGETPVVVQGKTTEAGVRGLLQSDARPVLFDESDVDSQNDKERIQSILALARASSYSDGGGVVKGTQIGTARTYTIRSMFAFSSIGVQLNQQSDRSRFTTLGLISNEGIQSKDEFKEFNKRWNKKITTEYVHRLQARTFKLMPTIIENTKTFADAAAHVIGSKRMGDQVGAMLAGAYSLSSTNVINLEDAIEWVKKKDWSEEKGLELTKDEWQLWNTITSHILRVESEHGFKERNVGELIKLAGGYTTDKAVLMEDADSVLRRMGILVNGNGIYISNTSPELKKIIRNTNWAHNHNKILERLPNSEKMEARRFTPGHNARCVAVPIELVVDRDNKKVEIEENGDDLPF